MICDTFISHFLSHQLPVTQKVLTYQLVSMRYGAAEKTRTSTGFTPQRPQRCASTSSATAAFFKTVTFAITKGYALCKINNIFNVFLKKDN